MGQEHGSSNGNYIREFGGVNPQRNTCGIGKVSTKIDFWRAQISLRFISDKRQMLNQIECL